MLPAWRPVPSFGSTMITFSLFGLAFLGIGIMLYTMSDKIEELQYKYNQDATASLKGCGTPSSGSDGATKLTTTNLSDMKLTPGVGKTHECEITIKIESDMKAPVFVYYQLDNFYQNHRRYVKSKDYKQLMGETVAADSLSQCAPIEKNSDLSNVGIFQNVAGAPLVATSPAIPCGLIAKSIFTDSYSIKKKGTTTNIPIYQKGIAWKSDVDYKFKNQAKPVDAAGATVSSWQDIQWIDIEQEHFIVWMRTAGLPNFRKLWGKLSNCTGLAGEPACTPVDANLDIGEYTVTIQNNYDVSSF